MEIGHFCSIGSNVQFFLGGEHNYKNMMTYPVRTRLNHECEAISNGPIIIEDDVWIGANTIILSGVKIDLSSVLLHIAEIYDIDEYLSAIYINTI